MASSIEELFNETKKHIDLQPKNKHFIRSVTLIDSKMTISNRCKCCYDPSLDEPPEELELDEEFVQRVDISVLSSWVTDLARGNIKSSYYADSWLTIFLPESELLSDTILSNKDYGVFLSKFQIELKNKLDSRNNNELLYSRLFQLKIIFETLIFLESGFIRGNIETGYKTRKLYFGKEKLAKQFNVILSNYSKKITKYNLNNILYGISDSLKKYDKYKYDNEYGEISLSNYSLLVMAFTGQSDKDIRRYITHSCRSYMKKIKRGKVTKHFLHILCCMIYELLNEHAKNRLQKGKAYRRGLTAEILSTFSPIKENGEPFYTINERGVEFALTETNILNL